MMMDPMINSAVESADGVAQSTIDEPGRQVTSGRSRVQWFGRLLPLIAVVIFGVSVWRIAHPRTSSWSGAVPERRLPAPVFQLYDQNNRIVKLEAYLNRHPILLVFFDGEAGPQHDPTLKQLRQMSAALAGEGVIVLGISTALPQDNRLAVSKEWPFVLLSDVAAADRNSVHRVWRRLVEPATPDQPPKTMPGIFFIDRSGLVRCDDHGPIPEPNSATVLQRIFSGA